ncbi:MAG: T9SS type A sorting domain-containing protein [Ignavibacteria bacterium]|nr:T9SS type A sorting domain-containing protein [Ignavibacteria bacterium]
MQKFSAPILTFVFVVLLSARLSAQQPVILRFQPPAASSGETVTIIGQNFANVTNVLLGRVDIRNFTVNNFGDTIRAIVSSNAESGLITVVQLIGTTTSSASFTFLGCSLIGTALGRVTPTLIPAGSRDTEITFEGFFNLGGRLARFIAISQTRDTVLRPFRQSNRLVSVTLPTVFLQQPGFLRLTLDGICQTPLSTTITIQAQSPTSVEMIPPVPERIFPNPASDDITLETTLERPATLALAITNTLGQHLIRLQQDAPSGLFRTTIPCRQLPPGAYFLEIRSPERRTLHHLIKN